jgi:sulfite reductase alpha subunit-like flavoprotein
MSGFETTPGRRVRILYASETGNAEDLAYSLFGILREQVKANISSISSYDVTQLPEEEVIIFVLSTTGDGECPSSMVGFWKFLLQKNLPKTSLASVAVAVFGLGDSSYEKYNAAARRLMMRVKQLGAKELVPLGLGDDQHTHGFFTGYEKWLKDLGPALGIATTPVVPATATAITPSSSMEGKSMMMSIGGVSSSSAAEAVEVAEYTVKVTASSLQNSMYAHVYDNGPRARIVYEPPYGCKMVTGSAPLYARVRKNTRMTHADWPQDVRHLSLDIGAYSAAIGSEGGVVDRSVFKSWPPYAAGDVATVHPVNPKLLVEQLLAMTYQIDDFDTPRPDGQDKDTFVSVFRNRMAVGEGNETDRKSRLGDVSCTLLDLFSRYLDIAGMPRRSFFAALSLHASLDEEREKLLELSSAEGFSLFHEYVVRERRNYVEVLIEFPSARPPLSWLLQMIPPLQPRHYSIASSPAEDPRCVELCVAVDERVTPYSRKRRGLCSSYLAGLRVGEEVVMWLREGAFRNPGGGVPLIMVGPGTGVAPMRSLMRERRFEQKQQELSYGGGEISTFLFFGCRRKGRDYLYGAEWDALATGAEGEGKGDDSDFRADTDYAVTTAFSQDGPAMEGKTYVMHKMRVHGETLFRLLTERGAHFLVAGSAQRMPADVRTALCDIIEKHGDCSAQEAGSFVKALEKSGRYRVEAWSS